MVRFRRAKLGAQRRQTDRRSEAVGCLPPFAGLDLLVDIEIWGSILDYFFINTARARDPPLLDAPLVVAAGEKITGGRHLTGRWGMPKKA